MRVHKSLLTEDGQARILAAVEQSLFGTEDTGFCVACGEEAYFAEPDAERLTCEGCGQPAVYGAEQLLLLGVVS